MSWKKTTLQIGLLAIDYGLKQRKKKNKTSKKRKNTKKKG